MDTILPLYVFHGLVQIVLEARASEHSARMVAMKGATENAKNIIGGLTLDYNKARQTQITNELLEIHHGHAQLWNNMAPLSLPAFQTEHSFFSISTPSFSHDE